LKVPFKVLKVSGGEIMPSRTANATLNEAEILQKNER
jgi:hypothetical protein